MGNIIGLLTAFALAAIFLKAGVAAIMWLGPIGCAVLVLLFLVME